MKHARSDYDPIQDPRGKIPEDEPVFLLRAQDAIAWHVVKIYAFCCELAGNLVMAKVCRDHAERMKAWPVKKAPDLAWGECPVCLQPHDPYEICPGRPWR